MCVGQTAIQRNRHDDRMRERERECVCVCLADDIEKQTHRHADRKTIGLRCS